MQRSCSYKMIMVAVLVSAAALPAMAQQAPALPPLPMPALPGGTTSEITLPQLPDPAGATDSTATAPALPALPAPASDGAVTPVQKSATPPMDKGTQSSVGDSQQSPSAANQGGGTQTAPTTTAEQKQFSYGSSDLSLFFQPTQITRMKEAIVVYESVNRDAKPKFEESKPAGPAPVVMDVKEPDAYPVFFLSSIVYDGPADWSIWIGGAKITSRKNETDVQVLSVSRDSATLAWRPDYAEAVAKRKSSKQFAATDAVKNKLAVVQRISHDPQTGVVSFTLRQNQSFAVGYFSIFEGYVDSPKLTSLVAMAPANDLDVNGPAVPIDPATGMPAPEGGMPTNPQMNPAEMPPEVAMPQQDPNGGVGMPPSPGMPPAPSPLPSGMPVLPGAPAAPSGIQQ